MSQHQRTNGKNIRSLRAFLLIFVPNSHVSFDGVEGGEEEGVLAGHRLVFGQQHSHHACKPGTNFSRFYRDQCDPVINFISGISGKSILITSFIIVCAAFSKIPRQIGMIIS